MGGLAAPLISAAGTIGGAIIGGKSKGATPSSADIGREPWATELAQKLYEKYLAEMDAPLETEAITPEEEQTLIGREMEQLGLSEQETMRRARDRAAAGGYIHSPVQERLYQPIEETYGRERSGVRRDISVGAARERRQALINARNRLWERGLDLYGTGRGTAIGYNPTTAAGTYGELGGQLGGAIGNWLTSRRKPSYSTSTASS